jgi:Holliday junction resolvase RusA-like endonuclease
MGQGMSCAPSAVLYTENNCRTLRLVLPGERPRSLNQVYRRVHWSELTRYAATCSDAILVTRAHSIDAILEPPVTITITAYCANPPDSDNLAVKPYIDALRRQGVIPDDRASLVPEVRLRSIKAPRAEQRLEIEITEVRE